MHGVQVSGPATPSLYYLPLRRSTKQHKTQRSSMAEEYGQHSVPDLAEGLEMELAGFEGRRDLNGARVLLVSQMPASTLGLKPASDLCLEAWTTRVASGPGAFGVPRPTRAGRRRGYLLERFPNRPVMLHPPKRDCYSDSSSGSGS